MWPFPQPGTGQIRSARLGRLFELHRQAQVQTMFAGSAPELPAEAENQFQRRAIASALSSANERSAALESQVADWRKGRPYQLVGRLVVSNVYNGERLPKMYRIQSVSRVDGSPRTLGYVTPAEFEQQSTVPI